MTIRALLIDDDRRLFELLGDYLGKHGVVVEHAADGPSGLAASASGGHDVVLRLHARDLARRGDDRRRAGPGRGGVVTHVLAIAGRELRSLFVSPVAYVVLTLWSVLAGTFFLSSLIGFDQNTIVAVLEQFDVPASQIS